MDGGQEGQQDQKCCLGALFLRDASKGGPTCLGFQHTPEAPVKVEQRDPSAEGWSGFKFVCLGNSLYSKPGPGGGGGDGRAKLLPYCEGIELVIAAQEATAAARTPDAAAAPGAAAAAAAAAGMQQQAAAAARLHAAQRQGPPQKQEGQQQLQLKLREVQDARTKLQQTRKRMFLESQQMQKQLAHADKMMQLSEQELLQQLQQQQQQQNQKQQNQQQQQQQQQQQTAPAAPARAAQPQPQRQPQQPQPQPQVPRPSWQTLTNSLGSADDMQRFAGRFQAVAARNASSMQRALDTAYATTVKPVLDRLSPGGPRA
ncbi:MAG: hypothetical protein J3K34DRAFT_527551 [Monoraphidium minutum]|nr:MAG: hypothetical protein J3K34DRAFT_527551 [Monoraphidium minutum]